MINNPNSCRPMNQTHPKSFIVFSYFLCPIFSCSYLCQEVFKFHLWSSWEVGIQVLNCITINASFNCVISLIIIWKLVLQKYYRMIKTLPKNLWKFTASTSIRIQNWTKKKRSYWPIWIEFKPWNEFKQHFRSVAAIKNVY